MPREPTAFRGSAEVVSYHVAAVFSVPTMLTRIMTKAAGRVYWTEYVAPVSPPTVIGSAKTLTNHQPSRDDTGNLCNRQRQHVADAGRSKRESTVQSNLSTVITGRGRIVSLLRESQERPCIGIQRGRGAPAFCMQCRSSSQISPDLYWTQEKA